ncbi:S9 family peptidase [Gloeobacter kilaueensis]|uniref:Peptidase S9 prolyl oligopeptidase n=1 Tax=Gloeobacter kilaueensis (strain ATCC BAA-2537 / CCAP 1431/1 / ULC 316 / JS1) TaxID=1183438 RepID=U5QLE1_GLOK1|nr:S9 family peptidase [Gloeobacter kilaueensis]AGY59751.1 peptidase S9 prolyl oligopeptidase [Gloeobacter kilaueensis JS1]
MRYLLKSLVVGAVLAGCSLLTVPPASAELPPLIPRAVLFDNPEKASPQISPDGKKLAYLKADAQNILQVWVRTIGKEDDRQVTQDKKRGITIYLWAYNQDLLYLQDKDGDENYHLYAVDPDRDRTRDLTPFSGVRASLLSLEPERPNQVVITLNRRNKALFEPYRLDLVSGELVLAAENPGNYGNWLVDSDFQVRGAVELKATGGGDLKLRDNEKAPWRTAISWSVDDTFDPVDFSKDGKTIAVTTNLGADTLGLYALDIATGKLNLLADDKTTDLADLFIEPRSRRVQAVAFDRDRVRWQVLDPAVKQDFAELAKVSPGNFDVANRDLADKSWLVVYTADNAPTRYFVWDRRTKKSTYLFTTRPKLERYKLASMQPVEIPARDGLSLPSYLTLPVGVPAKNLPLVLNVHGGPWARDNWGYDPEAQWLANRGYAVLQVNYRGSTGFGKNFKNAAKKQFSARMHDDLVDAVQWAVGKGHADPKKVCIYGGSYGGYATLVGLTFTPELFRCGVDIVGPSNLVSLIKSFPPYWGPYLSNTWYPFVGNPDNPADRADLEARSPLFKVDRITAPLLIAQGANDPRVTKAESDQIVAALRKNNKPVEYLVFADEGHGFVRPENRLKFYAAAEQFLAKYLGGRTEPPTAAEDIAALRQ